MLRLPSHYDCVAVLAGIMAYGKNKKLTMPRAKKKKVEQSEQLCEAGGQPTVVEEHAVADSEACVVPVKHVVVESPEKEQRLAVADAKKIWERRWTEAAHMAKVAYAEKERQVELCNSRAVRVEKRYGHKRPHLAFEKICEAECMLKDAQLDAAMAKSIAMEQHIGLLMCENDALKLEIAKLKRSRRM